MLHPAKELSLGLTFHNLHRQSGITDTDSQTSQSTQIGLMTWSTSTVYSDSLSRQPIPTAYSKSVTFITGADICPCVEPLYRTHAQKLHCCSDKLSCGSDVMGIVIRAGVMCVTAITTHSLSYNLTFLDPLLVYPH